ncbi:MAG: HTTM domain-containing protein [Microscillaceae bacterium]
MNPRLFLNRQYLFEPVDNSPLVVFRMIFGFLIMAEAWGAILTGWVHETFILPEFTFNFIGFEFLQPLPGFGMYYYFGLMGFFGLLVMLGWYYRLAVSMYFLMWSGVYLMQKSHYNNHYYLLMLLLGIMIFLPAHRYASLDVWRRPARKSLSCARGIYVFLVVHIWIVYTYAATSKIYLDWLLAKPIKIWFGAKQDYWLIGGMLQQEWVHYLVAYTGIFYDLLVIPALLWRKTRLLALFFSLVFHLSNSIIFQIGIFPYLALSFALFIFPPDKVRQFFFRRKPPLEMNPALVQKPSPYQKFTLYAGLVYLFIQFLLPLRYHLYPGNVHWTEEGHRLSWKMMLRSKTGQIRFRVLNRPTKEIRIIEPHQYVSPLQARRIATHPDFVWQFVQCLKAILAREGWKDIEIYAESVCSLNGSPNYPLIKPDYDLARAEWSAFKASDWIAPFPESASFW